MLPLLLSLQAAGMIASYSSWQSQRKTLKMGRALEESQFEANLQALRLQATQESAQEARQVRLNIGSQIALNAARGGAGGSSSLGISQSLRSFYEDESMRKINLLTKQNALRGQNLLANLKTAAAKRELDMQFIKSIGNQFSSSAMGGMTGSTGATGNAFNWGVGQ